MSRSVGHKLLPGRRAFLTFTYGRFSDFCKGISEAPMRNEKTTEDVALGIRRRVFEHSIRNNGGYLSQACSAAEQLAWLYNEELNLGLLHPADGPETIRRRAPRLMNTDYHTGAGYNGPAEPEYDRLFIAPAHYALVAYATLIEVGRMAPEGS